MGINTLTPKTTYFENAKNFEKIFGCASKHFMCTHKKKFFIRETLCANLECVDVHARLFLVLLNAFLYGSIQTYEAKDHPV
jgi:hypothetical protein